MVQRGDMKPLGVEASAEISGGFTFSGLIFQGIVLSGSSCLRTQLSQLVSSLAFPLAIIDLSGWHKGRVARTRSSGLIGD